MMCFLLLLADILKNNQKGFYGKACNTEFYVKRIMIKVRDKNRQKKIYKKPNDCIIKHVILLKLGSVETIDYCNEIG
jgi:hypothetical protein